MYMMKCRKCYIRNILVNSMIWSVLNQHEITVNRVFLETNKETNVPGNSEVTVLNENVGDCCQNVSLTSVVALVAINVVLMNKSTRYTQYLTFAKKKRNVISKTYQKIVA